MAQAIAILVPNWATFTIPSSPNWRAEAKQFKLNKMLASSDSESQNSKYE